MPQSHVYEPISEHSTPRICALCLDALNHDFTPATHWRISFDPTGGKDKSSRVAVCAKHKE